MLALPKIVISLIALMAVSGKSVPKEEKPESRIIGGREATPGQYRYMVHIVINQQLQCGGSLVAPGLVLTAAHCISGVNPQSYYIRGNIHDLASQQATVLQATKVIPHPQFDPNYLYNDVAVIQVRPDPAMSSYLKLDTSNMATERSTVKVIGWGRTSPGGESSRVLKELDMDVLSPNVCRQHLPQFNDQSHFCASGKYQGESACQGDSGGPIVAADRVTVVGVVSHGSQNCDRYGAAFSRISTYAPWIAQYANSQGGQQQPEQPQQPEQQWEQPEEQWEQPEQQWEQPEEQWEQPEQWWQ